MDWTETLARNLVMAGGLCAAFEQGREWQSVYLVPYGLPFARQAAACRATFHPGKALDDDSTPGAGGR
jgi:hypothetical protein